MAKPFAKALEGRVDKAAIQEIAEPLIKAITTNRNDKLEQVRMALSENEVFG